VVDVQYDTVGNILAKTDVGSYAYADGRLAAYGTGVPVLLEHDDRGNVIEHDGQALTYTPFDELRQLVEGGETLDFRYDADGDRFSRSAMVADELVVDVRGLYERRVQAGALELVYRVPAAGRIVAQIVRTPGPAGTWVDEIESLHDDYLGSTHVVTDEAGAVVRTVAYDPWGQARAAENWLAPLDPAVLDMLGLGFTGHPARLDADLLDMGGRSYHPRLGRFFSPDPLVVAPLDGQAYNRYAYVRNGPLGATDPSGYGEQGLGSDDGGEGQDTPLGPDCSDPRGCVRPIFVFDADGNTSSALESWNRSLQMFDAPNGGGQGGPDFGRGGNGGNPYSPNGVRHGNDSGQPGGSPGFTIEVSEDMCAEIAACSGGQGKRGPSRIWDAPIDAWAATAADIATDFVPGVAQAKTAYDAYDRIQNGEDPVDVLMAAGADAALGLIPGLKAGKKIDKALDKAEDVADAAGDVGRKAK
jgi:RHS repeat-associated protein